MGQILMISGKKQSGKSSAAAFIQGEILKNGEWIHRYEIVDGNLKAFNKNGNEYGAWENSKHFVNLFGFADGIKEICVNYMGIPSEYIYGTDEQKNSLTEYRWENCLGLSKTELRGKPEFMTGREVMKYIGSDVFRRINPKIWDNYTFKRLKASKSQLNIVYDVRFRSEVMGGKALKAKTIRLTRNLFPKDKHQSEIDLDPPDFDQKEFDAIIDNRRLEMQDTHTLIKQTLMGWGWL